MRAARLEALLALRVRDRRSGYPAETLVRALANRCLGARFLPGYWQEEGYDGGRRFALLSWLPENWRMPVALLLALSCAVVAVLRSSGNRCC